jgi:1,4-alpha-glucan branching enzyme
LTLAGNETETPMTEAEWLRCEDGELMIQFLAGHPSESDRKLRLFTVACYQQGPYSYPLLEAEMKAVEEYADGQISMERLLAAHYAHYRDTLHYAAPSHPLIAEYWADQGFAVRDTGSGGLGFDGVWSAGLRDTVRAALGQAAAGAQAPVVLDAVRDALNRPAGFPKLWKSVEAVENHDEVYTGRAPRIARLSDGNNPRSWYARSRSRVATGLVLTAPGIPLLFMGQEFLEDKQWSDNDPNLLIYWDGVDRGTDKAMVDHLRFTRELIALRRNHAALRGEGINVFHVNNGNRVIAFQRWVEGAGRDVVVAMSLNESTYWGYALGFPGPGRWREVFRGF